MPDGVTNGLLAAGRTARNSPDLALNNPLTKDMNAATFNESCRNPL
jgi:hypothetical protein